VAIANFFQLFQMILRRTSTACQRQIIA